MGGVIRSCQEKDELSQQVQEKDEMSEKSRFIIMMR